MAQKYDYDDRNSSDFSDRDKDRGSRGRSADRSQSRGTWGGDQGNDEYEGASGNGGSSYQDNPSRDFRRSGSGNADQRGGSPRGYGDDNDYTGGNFAEGGMRRDRFGGDRSQSGGYGGMSSGPFGEQDRFGGGRMGGQSSGGKGGSFGFQAGQGGATREDQRHHDPHYHDWRERQLRSHDEEYQAFNAERQKKFDTEFEQWRANRAQAASDQPASSGSTSPNRPGEMMADKQNELPSKKG